MELFNPNDWVNNDEAQSFANNHSANKQALDLFGNNTEELLNRVVKEISAKGIDITADYGDWFRIGKAIANTLGEGGRTVFHEISRQNDKYKVADCDKKYDDCLRDSDSRISIGTFFQLAKDHGVNLSSATSATSATSANWRKECKNSNFNGYTSLNIREMNSLPPCGGLAEVAEVAETFSSSPSLFTFSDKLNPDHLTGIVREIFNMHKESPAKCDAMILGAINVVSGLMGGANGTTSNRSGIYGIYDGRRVFAPLYNIVYSTAGNDKGNLVFCKHLADDVRNEMRRQYETDKQNYEFEMAEYEASKKCERGSMPKEPIYRTPFIPGNSTTAALYRIMHANQGWGLMFETEADTISNMVSSEYGNYSDLMRKAHHHESLTMERVKDNLHIDIDEPRLSIFLTCTPGQLPHLLPSFENGLGSRFLFYNIPDEEVVFHDVFAKEKEPLEDVYKAMSYKISVLYHALLNRAGHPIQFLLSEHQQKEFISTYKELLKEQFKMLGKGIRAFIFRMALENFRLAMVLTMLRRLDDFLQKMSEVGNTNDADLACFDDMENAINCSDEDFEIAMTIVGCLINHTARVYSVMAKEDDNPFSTTGINLPNGELTIYKALPDTDFKTSEFLEIAKNNDIKGRTAERLLSNMTFKYCLIEPVSRGVYRKKPILSF